MPIVVSDTSPIRALAFLGRLDLFASLFDEVLVPPSVVRELENPARGPRVVESDLQQVGVVVQSPSDADRVAEFREIVDAGEAEAIALALQVGADELLVDDAEGRKLADRLALHHVGTLGLLLRAKRRDQLTAVLPLIDRLRHELNFFVSDSLRTQILRLAGEEEREEDAPTSE